MLHANIYCCYIYDTETKSLGLKLQSQHTSTSLTNVPPAATHPSSQLSWHQFCHLEDPLCRTQSIELILCDSEWEFSFFITIAGTLSFQADFTFRVSQDSIPVQIFYSRHMLHLATSWINSEQSAVTISHMMPARCRVCSNAVIKAS